MQEKRNPTAITFQECHFELGVAVAYFKRQCWISTEHEKELPMIISLVGDDKIVFSTDYPHGDSDFPHAVEEFLEMDGIAKESQKKILWDNCARLYNLS